MTWKAGQRLQGRKYVIEKVLGQGGFGITYKALQVKLKLPVVIKTPNEFLSYDPEYEKYVERFIQEGQRLARLSQEPHPHIVGVIDLFQEGATHCLVMDFVPGENLFQTVRRRGALPEAEIVPYIRQIGEALVVVHQAGLVHRDAHPGNIMLRSNGKAVLIDFGIAKGLVPKTLTSKGIAGNEGFAPYEQMIRGSREPTVDVYCLAATLYYGVTGQPPTNSQARKLGDTSLKPPKQINPRINDRLNQAILKGMALEAKDRPQSMQAWLAMLEPPQPITIPWKWLINLSVSYGFIGLFLSSLAGVARVHGFFWVLPMASMASMALWVLAVTFVEDKIPPSEYHESIRWAGVGAWAVAFFYALILSFLMPVLAKVPIFGYAFAGSILFRYAFAGIILYSMVWVLVGARLWAESVAWARDELQKSLTSFHTFLILACTSGLGLGLGWLLGLVLSRK